MGVNKEREAFERFKAKQIGIDYETLKKDLDDCEKRFPNNRYAGWNFKSDWELWQAAKAQAVPKWVSVEDRLPPCDFEFCETGEHVSNAVLIHSVATYGFNMGMGHVNEDGFWSAYSGEHDFMNVLEVTHWIPLPDAPQEPAND